jgi:hypothetical protein
MRTILEEVVAASGQATGIRSPLSDLSFTCLALHLIDPASLLLRRRDLLQCVRHFQSCLCRSFQSDDPVCQDILVGDCRDSRTCLVRDEVLADLSKHLGMVLAIREEGSLRCHGEGHGYAQGALIARVDGQYVLLVERAGTPEVLEYARAGWVRDTRLGPASLKPMRKA